MRSDPMEWSGDPASSAGIRRYGGALRRSHFQVREETTAFSTFISDLGREVTSFSV